MTKYSKQQLQDMAKIVMHSEDSVKRILVIANLKNLTGFSIQMVIHKIDLYSKGIF